ncbi:cupin domain-containing protein [Lachnospiraceae bacterium 62-35]
MKELQRQQKGAAMFVLEKDFQPEVLENGVVRTIKGYIKDLMVAELVWKKGQKGAVHTHPHRQCDYIVKGVFEANLDGKKQILKAGECFYIEANVPHGLTALEDDGVLLDIFTPMREDFI